MEILGVQQIFCGPCNKIHDINLESSPIRVLVTSSTLAGFHEATIMQGQHWETISISGSRLLDLLGRLRVVYGKQPRSLVVLVIAGLNDVITQVSIAEFRNHLEQFMEFFHEHERTFGVKDFVSFIPLFNPPILRGNAIHISKYNEELKQFNEGPRTVTSYDLGEVVAAQKAKDPRVKLWREVTPSQRLHLKDHLRRKIHNDLVTILLRFEIPPVAPQAILDLVKAEMGDLSSSFNLVCLEDDLSITEAEGQEEGEEIQAGKNLKALGPEIITLESSDEST